MTRRVLIALCGCGLWTASGFAQARGGAADPISGTWIDDSASGAGLVLKFDGKRDVSGTVLLAGRAPDRNPPIKKGTFDPNTGVLKLEGEDKLDDGSVSPYVIEATLGKNVLTGTFLFGKNKGTFKFTKKEK